MSDQPADDAGWETVKKKPRKAPGEKSGPPEPAVLYYRDPKRSGGRDRGDEKRGTSVAGGAAAGSALAALERKTPSKKAKTEKKVSRALTRRSFNESSSCSLDSRVRDAGETEEGGQAASQAHAGHAAAFQGSAAQPRKPCLFAGDHSTVCLTLIEMAMRHRSTSSIIRSASLSPTSETCASPD